MTNDITAASGVSSTSLHSADDSTRYGGCEGADAMYVKLVSSVGEHASYSPGLCAKPVFCLQDGHEFIIKKEHALTSGTIKAMLSGPGQFAENETNEVGVFSFFLSLITNRSPVQVNFKEIPSHVLQKVCQYFIYKVRFTNSTTEIPEFPITPEVALELLMAANFLDC
jgi:transcription elongation factor B subunit 1